jgi:hypothetical protein
MQYEKQGSLKGQCHKMMVEICLWSGSLGLNYDSRTLLFRLKIGRLKDRIVHQ